MKGKIQKASEVLGQCPLLDRTKCFETVAAGVKAIVPDSVVDLKSPEVILHIDKNSKSMLHYKVLKIGVNKICSYVFWWNSYHSLEYQMAPM